jgi:thioredoxin-related protein
MPENHKFNHYLEIATNIAVLLVATVVLLTFAWNYFRTRQITTQLQQGLQKQAILAPQLGINYGNSTRTLLIAMNTKCDYCSESVPFYNQLAELQRNRGEAFRTVAIFPNSSEEVRRYVEQKKLDVPTIAAADFQRLNLAGTPTMILVDSQGKVLDFWVGKLSANGEKEVIEKISS